MKNLPYCIQCTDLVSNTVGSFAYDPLAYAIHKQFQAVSPVFNDVAKLYDWAVDSGVGLTFDGKARDLSGFGTTPRNHATNV